MSVTFNSEPSEMEMKLVNNIKDVNSKFILFNNIIFDCDQIKDAAGHVFLRDDPCRIIASSTDMLVSDTPRKWCQLSCGHSFTFAGLGSPAACIVCGRRVEGGTMTEHKAYISMPRHNGERFAKSMAEPFEQMNVASDNGLPNGDAVDIMRKAAQGGFEGSIGSVVKNAKKLLGMDPYKGEDRDMMRQLADMVERDYASKDAIDKWLRAFQLEHGDIEMSLSDPATLNDLWTSIADDIPFGYEASKRLADWLQRIGWNNLEAGDMSGIKALEKRIEALESSCDGLRKQRDHWHDIAVGVYRRFYSHWEHSVPDDPTNLINAAIDAIERERDEWKAKAETRDGEPGRSVFVDGDGATELYAKLEDGTCEIEKEFVHVYGGEGCDTYEFALSCGHSVEWLDSEPPRHCPTCGKAVKESVYFTTKVVKR